MAFDPIVVDPFDLGYTLLSAFVVVFGLLSLFLKERLYIGEAVWATVFGIIIGPYCAGVFNPRNWGAVTDYNSNDITIQVTRIVLSVGVFAIGVELPKAYVGRHWKSLTFLLVPIMIFGWFVSSAFIYALIPGLDYLSSLAIAACLTPTDPILAAAVVGGRYAEKHVPAHLRHLLAAESGVNDGAAFPMLFISIYLILDKTDSAAVGHWFYITWVYEIILGTVLGGLLGYVARHAMKYCERHDLIDRHSYVAQYISLALLSNGITTILGSDDLLSSFACGTAFAYDGWFNKKTEETLFSNVIDLIFNCACFIYIGAWIPFGDFNDQSLGGITWWRLFIIGLLVIVLRRLPIMLLLYKWIPEVKTFREAVFSGHFGPMGVGAVFISTLAVQSMPEFYPQEAGRPPETQLELLSASIQPIVAFIVLMSIAIHGLSIPFFSLGKRVHSISRTWSRHTSMEPGGTPEWAAQARRIRPGEEIVINRDQDDPEESLSKLERGELPPRSTSPEAIAMTPTSSASGSLDEKRRLDEEHRQEEERLAQEKEAAHARGDEVDGVTERDNSLERQPGGEGHAVAEEHEHEEGYRHGGREGRMDRPPITVRAESGGSNVIPDREQRPGDETEWREGNDLIIERKIADGEEVEVEVIRDRFHDELPSMSKVVRGAKDNMRAHLGREGRTVKEGIHELERRISPNKANRSASPKLQVVQEWKPFHHTTDKEKEEATTAPKRTATRSSSKDDEDDKDTRQSSSDTEGADVEDNRGEGTSSGAILAAHGQAGPSNSRSPSPGPARDRESSDTKQSRGARTGRRESIRRKLFGRTRFAKSAKPKRSTGKARQSQSDAEESEEDGDGEGETEVEADPLVIRRDMHHSPGPASPASADTERPRNRSRSESPHPLRSSEHSNTGSERQRRRARFQLPAPQSRDEVEDPASLSSAPSPNILHQKLDTLVANSEGGDESQPQSRQGSGSTSGHSRVHSLGGRSIRFAEQEGPFIRSGSSSSLQRLGQTHQHLHYQHSSARRASPGPGSVTPRRNHTPHSYTPSGSHIHNHHTSGDET